MTGHEVQSMYQSYLFVPTKKYLLGIEHANYTNKTYKFKWNKIKNTQGISRYIQCL